MKKTKVFDCCTQMLVHIMYTSLDKQHMEMKDYTVQLCDYSLGDLTRAQVHAHMQLASMILFPKRELLSVPSYAERIKMPKVALTANSKSNSDTLFDLAQICKLYNNLVDIRRGGSRDDRQIIKDLQASPLAGNYDSLQLLENSGRPYMNAFDCLKFLNSDRAVSLKYNIFVDEIVLSSDQNESCNEKERSHATKTCEGKEEDKERSREHKKRFLTEARKQQMRAYSKNSYYRNKAMKEQQNMSDIKEQNANEQSLCHPPSYQEYINSKHLFPDYSESKQTSCFRDDEFMNTCAIIMKDVLLELHSRCSTSSDCDNNTNKKRKRAQSVRDMSQLLFEANTFLFADSTEI